MRLVRSLGVWLLLGLVVALAVYSLRSRPTSVEVVQPSSEELAEVIALSGQVRGVQESQLAPEVVGTVRALLVSEGESVKKGQKLALLDTDRLQAQYQQTLQRVRVAEAQLALASRNPLPSEVEQVRSEVEAQKLAAKAALASAQQRLLESETGPRMEQQDQARAALRQAKAESEQSAREAQRQAKLLLEGAVAQQNAEQAQTALQRSLEAEASARAKLDELENGTRPEQIEQARQGVAAAQADLMGAQRAGDARLTQLLDQPRVEDVRVAEAQVREARSASVTANEQLKQAEVVAPYDGIVGRRLLRVGDQAGPNAPIITFTSQPALEIRVDVDESDRARLFRGQTAQIRAGGFAESFQAEVKELSPQVDTLRGTLEVRLAILKPPSWLLPGQTVDVNLILTKSKPRLVLPLTSVVLKGDGAEVAAIEGELLRWRAVEVSSPTERGYLVNSGVEPGDKIALYPQGLREGQRVRASSSRK
jgi:RND family efflux transporter MFP subunit